MTRNKHKRKKRSRWEGINFQIVLKGNLVLFLYSMKLSTQWALTRTQHQVTLKCTYKTKQQQRDNGELTKGPEELKIEGDSKRSLSLWDLMYKLHSPGHNFPTSVVLTYWIKQFAVVWLIPCIMGCSAVSLPFTH
jgi:hypothetical protein